jgi:hypothetical protein
LRENLKNGVVGGSKKGDFIGLICYWGKNWGKNEQKFAFFCIYLQKFAKINKNE